MNIALPKENSISWRVWRMNEVTTSIPLRMPAVSDFRPTRDDDRRPKSLGAETIFLVLFSSCLVLACVWRVRHGTQSPNPTLTPREPVKRVNDAQHDEQHRLPRLERHRNRNRQNHNSRRIRPTRTPPHTHHRSSAPIHPALFL
jgi:hypothetical protein